MSLKTQSQAGKKNTSIITTLMSWNPESLAPTLFDQYIYMMLLNMIME